ncbi:TMEM43 family protein [Patescibacteria group bacterium]
MAEKHFGDKLVGSIGWLLLGIVIFLASFWLLHKTIVRTDYTDVADRAIEITESKGDSEFVYVTGEFKSDELLSDGLYLDEGEYLVIDRTVEMFAWVETVETDEDDFKYYDYDKQWVDEVPDSSKFDDDRYFENPEKPERNLKEEVNTATVGGYEVDLNKLRLPSLSPLELSDNNVTLYEFEELQSDENYDYIFDGNGTFEEPEVGDVRIKFSVLEPYNKVTVFGRLDGKELVAHHQDQEKGLYRVFDGTLDDSKSVLAGEYKTAGTMGEIGVMILMWIGLMLVLKPLSVSLELIPFLGKFGKGALVIITAILAFAITKIAATILAVVNSLVGLGVIAAVVIGLGVYFYTRKQPTTIKPQAPKK